MNHDTHTLVVSVPDPEAFALCLALGTLEAIRSGAWPTEAETWTIARPTFRALLETAGVTEEVLAIFRGADELSALEHLAGRQAVEQRIAKWIKTLRARLAALPERSWHARWQ